MNGEIIGKSSVIADATTAFDVSDCREVTFIVTKTGATTFKLQESDDNATFTDVDAKLVIDKTGTAAGTYLAAYLGYKKYVKAVLGTAANGSVKALKTNLTHQA